MQNVRWMYPKDFTLSMATSCSPSVFGKIRRKPLKLQMLDEFPANGVCWALPRPAHGKLRNFLLQRCPTIPDRVNGPLVVPPRWAPCGSEITLTDKYQHSEHHSQHHHDQWKNDLNAINWETSPDHPSHLGSHMLGRAEAIWVLFGSNLCWLSLLCPIGW